MANFDIIEATKKGVLKTWEDRAFLLRDVVLTAVVHAICFYFALQGIVPIEGAGPDEAPFKIVMGTPMYIGMAAFFIGLFFFSHLFVKQARLVLVRDEEAGEISDQGLRDLRKKSYIIGTVIIVGFFLFRQLLGEGALIVSEMLSGVSSYAVTVFSVVNLLIVVWLLRFGVLHIPAAIGHSLKDFLYRVKGLKFSFYLLGLIFAVLVPCSFFFMFVSMLFVTLFEWAGPDVKFIVVSILLSISYVLSFTALNGASIYAVDEIMRKKLDKGES